MKISEELHRERVKVKEKIRALEEAGVFDKDVENDPESRTLLPDEIDYLDNGIKKRVKRKLAFFLAYSYFYIKRAKKEILIAPPVGIENMKTDSGAIVICNHFSPDDSFIMQRVFDLSRRKGKMYRIIREGNYTSMPGFYGFLMRNCNTLPLSSDIRTLSKLSRATKELLASKNAILVYPEAAMWWNYRKVRPFKSGAFDLAARYGVPIIPCFITMTDSKKIGKDGFPVQIYTPHIGEPIYPDRELCKTEASRKLSESGAKYFFDTYLEFYGKESEKSSHSLS